MNANFTRQAIVGFKTMVVMTVILGVVYPAVVWAIGQIAFNDKANGQIVRVDGVAVGSSIIGQQFPVGDPQWFHGRPSAVDYNGLGSGGSNLGPSNPELLEQIKERRQTIAKVEGVELSQIPAGAVTASWSGLDPHISPEYAELQVERVAKVRELPESTVRALVEEHTSGRQYGFLGEPTVNVLELNLALAGAY